jgi:anti-sigma regulatory factor (Ser/Thr protein kinase)
MAEPRSAPMLVRDFDAGGLVALRHDVTRLARENGLADVALYRFVLGVHEIAANAVRHGGGSGRLELWQTDGVLRCRISDRGPGIPPDRRPSRPAPDTMSGRGLWLAQLAGDMTTVSSRHGTTVTLACPLAARPA